MRTNGPDKEFSNAFCRQKWDEDDMEMFKLTLKKFSEDLNRLSDNIKNKTINQIKGGIKRKIQDQKGTPVLSPTVKKVAKVSSPVSSPVPNHQQSKLTPKVNQSSLNSFTASSMDSLPDEVEG